ncbi:MAG: TonB-dependent receptor [Opitutus sp.]
MKRQLKIAGLLCMTAATPLLRSQTREPAEKQEESTVLLTPFTVTGEPTGRYQSSASTSGSRIATNIMDATQSISIVTRDLMEDVGAMRILEAAKYVAGVGESTIPYGLDRISIRGFQTEGQTVDGFRSQAQANLDPVFIERIEIVKGPNAILAPAGAPGGAINNVTRKPQYRDFASVAGIVGLFDAQRIEIDVNRAFSQSTAFRVSAAFQDTEGFADNYKKVFAVMPMVAYRTKGGAEALVQVAYTDWKAQNYMGLPLDPAIGPDDSARTLSGVPRDLNVFGDDFRLEKRFEARGLLTVPLTETVAMRLAGRYTDFDDAFGGTLPSNAAGSGGAINPLTGRYTPGFVYGPGPTFTPIAATPQPRIFQMGGTVERLNIKWTNAQADFVHKWNSSFVNTTVLAGAAFNYYRQNDRINNVSKPEINYDAPVVAKFVEGQLALRQDTINYDQQAYVNATVGVWQERVLLTGGYSYSNYDLGFDDFRAVRKYRASVEADLTNYGIVIKPIPSVSLYYGHSENAIPQSALSISNGSPLLQQGEQDEEGVRVQLIDKRLFVTVAHFDITQHNFAVPNPGNAANPIPPLPPLLSERIAKGWEYELHGNLTPEWSMIASYSNYTNRDPYNIPVRGSPEQTGALWNHYRFAQTSPLKGFSVGLGIDYLGKRPGDGASGFTAASTPSNIIPNGPTFYLPARTLVSISGGYSFNEHWRAQVNVDNVLNKDYLIATINRSVVTPGDPINVRLKMTYGF